MAASTAWSFRGFYSVFANALNNVIDNFKNETVKAVAEEQKKAIFSFLSGQYTRAYGTNPVWGGGTVSICPTVAN
jgi:tRNA A37 threonylcarbamoyltransferase TsaD